MQAFPYCASVGGGGGGWFWWRLPQRKLSFSAQTKWGHIPVAEHRTSQTGLAFKALPWEQKGPETAKNQNTNKSAPLDGCNCDLMYGLNWLRSEARKMITAVVAFFTWSWVWEGWDVPTFESGRPRWPSAPPRSLFSLSFSQLRWLSQPPNKHSHTLSVRRHNQELSFAPAPRGLLRCIVVVGVLGGTGGWLRPPELALAHCYGYCWRPQQPVRPSHGGGREGGKEGYVTAKQNTGPPAAKTIAA